jgi:hypothetical protein
MYFLVVAISFSSSLKRRRESVVIVTNDELPLQLGNEQPLTIDQTKNTSKVFNPIYNSRYAKEGISDLHGKKVEDKRLLMAAKKFKSDNAACEKTLPHSDVNYNELERDFASNTKLRSKSIRTETHRRETMERENVVRNTTHVSIVD